MYKDNRYINAGTNEFYRYGKAAQAKVRSHLEPNESGFYSIPADGGKYWTIGTSEGKFGEFAKIDNSCLPVNKAGNVWAKVGTEKAKAYVKLINRLLFDMELKNAERAEGEEFED